MKKHMTLALIIITASFVMAQAQEESQRDRRGKTKGLAKKLNLSQEQIKQMREFREENKIDRKSSREKFQALKQNLKQSFISGDESAVAKYQSQLRQMRIDKMQHKHQRQLQMLKILNKEQRQKFIELREARRGSRRRN